jgi:hypothetical protein
VGAVVHVHEVPMGAVPAYMIEVVIADAAGMQVDAHLVDASGDELEPA